MVDRTNLVIDQNGSTTELVNFGTANSLRFAPNDDSLIVIHQSPVQIDDNDATAFRMAWTSTTPESQTTGGSPEHLVHPPVSWGNVGTQTRLNSLLPTPQEVQTTNISTTPRYVAIHSIASSRLYEEERLYDDESSWTEWVRPILAAACFFVAAILLARSLPFSPWYAQRSATAAVATSQPVIKTIAIQDIDVGMRTMGQNPGRSQVETYPDPDPATSRKLVLRMTKESGGNLSVKLLRPLAWIEANSVVEGGTFFLDLPEMGAVGEAHVEAILPCPPIRPGPGNVGTGTFAHEAAAGQPILSVTFANGAHIHGVTDNHPTYSVTRQEFLPIGDMREGETVQLAAGTTTITHLTSRPARAGEMLYNLETHNEHVYQVTSAGVLVHNTCSSLIRNNSGLVRHAEDAGRSVQRSLDNLVGQLQKGNMNPGIGNRHLFNGIMEARARDGARVYLRNVGDQGQILAKSSKHNQNQVIGLLQQLYGN
jgi:hypothetical protein